MDVADDVIVVGAGTAGAATALVLARAGVRVALLDGRAGRPGPIGDSLPPAASALIAGLGLDERFAATAPIASPANRISWAGVRETADFIHSPYGPGWQIDRTRFDRMLLDAAEEAGVRVVRGRLRAAERTDASWIVVARRPDGAGERLRAGYAIDATGRVAALARRLGARRCRYDRLVAIVAYLATPTSPADPSTLVEATPTGWWYSAPLPDGRLAVAWFTDHDLLRRAELSDGDVWRSRLCESTDTRQRLLETCCDVPAERLVAPAGASLLSTVAGAGWLAVGDAATAHDPLSCFGISNALQSADAAAQTTTAALAGDREAASRYEAGQRQSFERILWLTLHHYGAEQRWPEQKFWRRRHEPLGQLSGPWPPTPLSA